MSRDEEAVQILVVKTETAEDVKVDDGEDQEQDQEQDDK